MFHVKHLWELLNCKKNRIKVGNKYCLYILLFLENAADINSFKHTTLSLIYESNFFRVLRICVAEYIFDFIKKDTVFSQHCNLFTQEQCHMFCETRKSFLTAYLRLHLGDIHREDI